MKTNILLKFIYKNFTAQKRIIIPFILSTGIMFALQYIMLSLIGNEYIQERNPDLPSLITFSNVLAGILVVVFNVYANQFVFKQRRKEFALNSILGMEKKHIRQMLFIETVFQFLVITLISIIGGYLFGSLTFMALNRFMENTGTTLMEYPFDVNAAVITIVFLGVLLLFNFILNSLQLSLVNPMQLMRGKRKGEKKSKPIVLWIQFLIGAVCLGVGYYVSWTTTGVVASMGTIFYAIILIVIGTYFLFISLSIFVLKALQKRESIYFKPNNFLSISGMIYRMRANAVSLASIAILVTGLIIVVGFSFSTYKGIEQIVDDSLTYDYQFADVGDYDEEITEIPEELEDVFNRIDEIAGVERSSVMQGIFVPMTDDEGMLRPLDEDAPYADVYAQITTQNAHNNTYVDDINLEEGEVAYSANRESLGGYETLNFMDEKYDTVSLDDNYVPSNVAVEAFYIVVNNFDTLKEAQKHYPSMNFQEGKMVESSIGTDVNIDVSRNVDQLDEYLDSIASDDFSVSSREKISKALYETNGGLIFIGVIVSITLLIGTFLMLYYKQISEGYEDRRNFDIMKKVGLPERLIKKTINTQVLWIFMLPMVVAVLHFIFTSNIIFELTSMVGINEKSIFITNYIIIAVVIAVLYGIMYLVTSKVYYNIINRK